MGQLYLITFKTSGKSYVGISEISAAQRWKEHIKPRNKQVLGQAFKKYGIADATLTVLADCDSWHELCALEIATIAERGTLTPNGYNVANGGQKGTLGVKYSAEVRNANSARAKKQFADPAVRAALSARAKARLSNPEARARMAAQSKSYYANPEARAAMSALKKRQNTVKVRLAQSERMKQRYLDPSVRAAVGERTRQRLALPEARAAHSIVMKQSHNTIEFKAAASAKTKLQFADPAARLALSERGKKMFADPGVRQRNGLAIATAYAKKAGRAFSYIRNPAIGNAGSAATDADIQFQVNSLVPELVGT